jgi:hypothetical protein
MAQPHDEDIPIPAGASYTSSWSLLERRIALPHEDVCCVCLENYPNTTFVGCGKSTGVVCAPCAERVLPTILFYTTPRFHFLALFFAGTSPDS